MKKDEGGREKSWAYRHYLFRGKCEEGTFYNEIISSVEAYIHNLHIIT